MSSFSYSEFRYVSVDPIEAVFDFSVEMLCHWWQSNTMANNRFGSMFFLLLFFFSLDFISYKNQFVYVIGEWSLKHICRWWMKNRNMISWLNDESGSNTMRLVNRLMHSYIDLYSINFQMIYTVNCFALDNNRCSNVYSLYISHVRLLLCAVFVVIVVVQIHFESVLCLVRDWLVIVQWA